MNQSPTRPYKPHNFKPISSAPHEKRIVAFDIEGGGGYRGFTCGAIVADNLYSFFTDRESMLAKIRRELHEGAFIISHNLQYDLPLLEGDSFPQGDLLFTPRGLLWVSYPDGAKSRRIFDSVNLFPRLSIEYLSEMVKVPKVRLPENILRALSRGQNWQLFGQADQALIRRRVLADAEILFLAVANLQELVLSLGGELQPTISGIAMDIYRRSFMSFPWLTLGPATNNLARPAFYGGRVENFLFGEVENVNLYDVNSLYPYAQSRARFPHPARLTLDFALPIAGKWLDGEGVAECLVEVPDAHIPVLPYRLSKKLFFPVGLLCGQWTLLDLRYALSHGAKLKRVDWALYSHTTFNPFEEFTEKLFAMRQGMIRSGSPQANFIKLILNSLYGRFGLNDQTGLYTIANVDHVADWDRFQGFTTSEINGSLFAFGRLAQARQPDYVNVLFAAQITSQARMILNDELLNQGEKAAYCDTDSILTTGTLPTGEGLGDWRCQMQNGRASLLGPKEYALFHAAMDAQYTVKGLPAEVAKQYFQEGAARFYKALSIREAIQRGLQPTEWVQVYKNQDSTFPKRQAVATSQASPASYYRSEPYPAEELARLASPSRPQPVGEVSIHGRVYPLKSPRSPGHVLSLSQVLQGNQRETAS